MTMRRILLIASMIVLGVFLLVLFFNPDKDPHDDDNRDICIALIDSEVSLECQFDNSKIWVNSNESINGLDDDLNGYIDDLYGWNFRDDNEIVFDEDSGNHATGLLFLLNGIAEGYENWLNNCSCSIMIIKILSDDNSARYSDLIEAIKYAENMGADICNLSIATNTANQTLYKTMKESKMLFVVAAGNDGLEIGHECNVYPAMYNLENTITVGSVDEKGAVSQFSNYSRKYVDIVAIGENLRAKDSSGNWIQYYGTTYSTAFVSAKAAYIMEKYETRNPKETKELIISKTTQHELLKEYVRYGSIE